jgi:TolB-like protein
MVDRKKISTEQGIVYHFEGTFREGDQRQRVVGRLRIRDGRVHAIYYLADDKDFSSFREILEDLDQSHRYFRP